MNPLDKIDALMSQGPSVTLETGDRLTKTTSFNYTQNGEKRVHTFTLLVEVRETNSVGFSYTVIEVLSEEGRPTEFTPNEAPTSGTMAWFGLNAALSRGDVVLND